MTPKKLIHSYPFVELPDPKIRYLISDEKRDPLAVICFENDGTPHLRYLRETSPDVEVHIIQFMHDRKRMLFGG